MVPAWEGRLTQCSLRSQSPVFKHRTLESSPLSSCETSDAEGPVPVNSAAVLKKSQPAGSSPCRGHVLRKAKVSGPRPRACRARAPRLRLWVSPPGSQAVRRHHPWKLSGAPAARPPLGSSAEAEGTRA